MNKAEVLICIAIIYKGGDGNIYIKSLGESNKRKKVVNMTNGEVIRREKIKGIEKIGYTVVNLTTKEIRDYSVQEIENIKSDIRNRTESKCHCNFHDEHRMNVLYDK